MSRLSRSFNNIDLTLLHEGQEEFSEKEPARTRRLEELESARNVEEYHRSLFSDDLETEAKTASVVPPEAQLLEEFREKLTSLGRASATLLTNEALTLLLVAKDNYLPERGSFEKYARIQLARLLWRHYKRHGLPALRFERRDQEFRDAATSGDAASRERFYKYLYERLEQRHRSKRAQRRLAAAGLTPEDFAQEVVSRFFDPKSGLRFKDEQPGQEASLVYAARVRVRHYKRLRNEEKYLALVQHKANWDCLQQEPDPTGLDVALVREQRRLMAKAFLLARTQLSRIQRQWLRALVRVYRTQEELNLAAAASQLGRNRSSAIRMLPAIQRALAKALRELGAKPLGGRGERA